MLSTVAPSYHVGMRDRTEAAARLKPQSHRIVRFFDRTIDCDWVKVRPIGNVGNRATSGSDERPMHDQS